MKRTKRILSFVFAVGMLFSFVSCGEKEVETKTEEQENPAEITQKDEAYLAKFLADYDAGAYDEKKNFNYEDLSRYFELASYKGISYPDDPMIRETVTDQEVEDYIAQIFLASEVSDEEYTTLTEGVVQRYDMLTLDYKGVIDGKEVANATAKDQSLLIGSGSFIKGFEEGLMGKNIGEEVVLNLRFSPYYQSDEVKGKDITFYVTIHKVQRPALPEFTVDVINKTYSLKLKNMDEARAWLKEMLTAQAKNSAYSYLATYLQDDILSRSTVKEYPQKELEHFMTHYKSYYSQYLEEGQTLEDFCKESMGISYEEFLASAEEYAKQEVGIKLMLYAIAEKENVSCTKEQISALIKGLYESDNDGYYGSLQSMVEDYINIYGADYFENQVLASAVMEVVTASAVKEVQ